MTFTNNQIGPSGNSPNQGEALLDLRVCIRRRPDALSIAGAQFVAIMKNWRNYLALPAKVPKVLIESAGYSPGQWADGISLACAQSTVTGNTVTDATDGAAPQRASRPRCSWLTWDEQAGS